MAEEEDTQCSYKSRAWIWGQAKCSSNPMLFITPKECVSMRAS